MKSLCSTLKHLCTDNRTHTLPQLMTTALTEYLPTINDSALEQTVERYIQYLKKAKMGQLVNGFYWPSTISNELREMLQYVLTREQAILAAPDPILIDSQNMVAGQGFSPQALFKQSCRLEKCLDNNEIADHQTKDVTEQITTWGAQLYEKFAEMILEASDEDDLTKRFNTAFVASECSNLFTMSLVYQRLQHTLAHMQKSEFFKDFYSNKPLYEKYDFMFEYCELISQHDSATPELRAIAEHLYHYIPLKAYEPCQQKRVALVSDTLQSLTVSDVFTTLTKWSNRAWRQHKDLGLITALFDELNNMLREDQKNLEAWEKIEALATQKPKKKAAYEIFAYRFATSDPSADPHKMLQELQPAVVAPIQPVNIVIVPRSSELESLSAFLNPPADQKEDGDDYLPAEVYTPAADGFGIARPGNPLTASLDNSPSLTALFCDEQEVDVVKTDSTGYSKKILLC